jgi:hypothetical protein
MNSASALLAAEIKAHPLMFTFRDIISGSGYLGGITLSGRLLMMQENDGKWWLYGVRPGAIAESGDRPEETFRRFRNRYRETLFDIAEESKNFEEFKAEVERFYYEPDCLEETRWEDAFRAARAQGLETPPPPFSNLPIESPEVYPAGVTIERLDGECKRIQPSDNVSDSYRYMAKAA